MVQHLADGLALRAEVESFEEGFLGAVLLDADFAVIDVSSGVVTIGGYSREELRGKSAFELIHPDDLERAGQAMAELTRTQAPTVDGMYRMRYADGTYGDYAVQANIANLGDTPSTVMLFSEATEALRAEEFARDAVDAMRMLGEGCDLESCLERVHRLTERHLPGTRLTITTIHPDGAQTHTRQLDGKQRTSQQAADIPPHVAAALVAHCDGPWRAFSRMAEFERTPTGARVTSVLTDDDNQLLGFVEANRTSVEQPNDREWMVHGLVRQVLTALLRRVQLDEQLRAAAHQDPLTGLANRRHLLATMAAVPDLAGSTLLLIDLDNFSWINNNLGHHVGDEALVALASRLVELCPPDAAVSRFGGDEFVVWSAAPFDALAFGKQLRASRIMPASSGDRRASIRCSIGAVRLTPEETAAAAIQRADQAMYNAKRSGGGPTPPGLNARDRICASRRRPLESRASSFRLWLTGRP